jgi:hypothetical protein
VVARGTLGGEAAVAALVRPGSCTALNGGAGGRLALDAGAAAAAGGWVTFDAGAAARGGAMPQTSQ